MRVALHHPVSVSIVDLFSAGLVVALVVGFALPPSDPVQAALDADTRSVARALLGAEREAATTRRDVIAVFDSSARMVTVLTDRNRNGAADRGEPADTVRLSPEVVIGRPDAAPTRAGGAAAAYGPDALEGVPGVVFRETGGTSGAAGLYLATRRAMGGRADGRNDVRLIEVTAVAGRVEAFRLDGDRWIRRF